MIIHYLTYIPPLINTLSVLSPLPGEQSALTMAVQPGHYPLTYLSLITLVVLIRRTVSIDHGCPGKSSGGRPVSP